MRQGCFEIGAAKVEVGEVFVAENNIVGQGRVFEEEVVEESVDNDENALGDVLGREVDGTADVCEVGDAGKRAHYGEKGEGESYECVRWIRH